MFRKQNAFTLVELMVTLVVLGIVMGVMLPGINSQVSKNRAAALGEDLTFALSMVRSEAVKRAGFVTLCASIDGATCSLNVNDWKQGFIAFVDYAAGNNNPIYTNATNPVMTTLRVWSAQDTHTEYRISQMPAAAASNVSFIRYTSLGKLANSPNGIDVLIKMQSAGTPLNCLAGSPQHFVISLVGMLRIKDQNCW